SPQATPSTPEEAVVARVASGLSTNWARWDELLTAYSEPAPIPTRAPLPRPIEEAHLTEAYRPAWEGLLLAPLARETHLLCLRHIATDALGAIHNTNSIPALELAYALTCELGANPGVGNAPLDDKPVG